MHLRLSVLLNVSICLLILISVSKTEIPADQFQKQSAYKNLSAQPLAFTVNQGQWDDKAKFRANAGGATMWFASDGAYYQFTRAIPVGQQACPPDIITSGRQTPSTTSGRQTPSTTSGWQTPSTTSGRQTPSTTSGRQTPSTTSGRQTPSSAPDIPGMLDREPTEYETMMIKASFVGANPNPVMVGVEEMEYKCNYFIGNDQSKWATDIPNYSAVMYEEIYEGIDLKYYGNGKQMEYDFIVSPGADFSQIKIQYEGAESLSINNDGELVVKTQWGEVVEQRPVIYQVENNSRIAIAGEYNLKGANAFGFELSSYNPDLPLVIDPVLSYSTYLGGSGDNHDESYGIVVNNMGNVDFPRFDGHRVKVYNILMEVFRWNEDVNMTVSSRLRLFV